MTPDPTNPRHALEASLTALLLGELPPDQAAFLRQAIATDPELARMYARLERTINLVRETAAEPAPQPAAHTQPLRLSPERREQVLQKFKTVNHPALAKPERKQMSWLIPTAIAATLLLLVGALALSDLSKARFTSREAQQLTHRKSVVNEDAADVPRSVVEGGQYGYTLGLNRNGQWPTDGSPASSANKRPETAGRNIVSAQPGDAASFAATPPPTIFLPPKLPESESELTRTAKALDGSTAGDAFFRVEGGTGGGGGGGAALNVPKSEPPLAEPNQAAGSYGISSEDSFKRRYALAGEAAATRAGAPLPSESKPQLGKPAGDSDVRDRTAGMPEAGTEIYPGVSGFLGRNNPLTQRETRNTQLADSNGAVLNWAYTGQPAQTATPVDPTTGLPNVLSDDERARATEQLSMFSPGPPKFTGGFTNPVYIGGLEGSTWLDKEHQKNGGVMKVDGANQLADNHALSFDLADSARAGTAGKPILGDVPSLGTSFKETPAQQKQEMAVEQGVNEAVMRQAYRIQLRERLADAKDAQSKNDLSKAAKLYDSASDLASKIGSDNAEPEMAQIRDGQAAVRAKSEPGQAWQFGNTSPESQKAGWLGVTKAAPPTTPATPALTTPAAIDPTTGLPLSDAAPSVDPTTGLPLPQRSATGPLVTRVIKVDPTTFKQGLEGVIGFDWGAIAQSTGGGGGLGGGGTGGGLLLVPRINAAGGTGTVSRLEDGGAREVQRTNESIFLQAEARQLFLTMGVDLSPSSGKSVYYNDREGTLVVRAKPEDLDTIQQAVDALAVGKKEIEKAWATPFGSNTVPQPTLYARTNLLAQNRGKQMLYSKLNRIRLDSARFENLPLREVAARLSEEAKKRDPEKRGVNFLVNDTEKAAMPEGAQPTDPTTGLPIKNEPVTAGDVTVNLPTELKDVTLGELLDAVVKTADRPIKYSVDNYGVVFSPVTPAQSDDQAQRKRVPTTPPPEPQPEIATRDNAFSTFSLNVSDVSFKLAAASLEKGVLPEPASIRSEEFINAFDYRDPEPAPGAPIAFAWERARYPFTQNRDLLRFSLKTAALGRQAGRPLNLVLLLDNSGSMERADRVSIIREALRVLATQLQPNDTLSVVLFARTPRLWVDGVPGNQAGKVVDEVSGLTPEGGTNLGDALDLAYQTARRHYLMAGINRVVLLTDGAANLGNVEPEELKKKVEANRKQGVALDGFGIGWEGYNDDLLEVLTRNGDGRYGFINTPEEAATEFAGQLAGALHVAASDVKVQVEFNPKRVTAYRQIGYAKHQLTKEQFRDNSVDAAELGAAESGNALYAVDVNGGGDGPLATVRVRYKVPGTMQYLEREWTVPYTGNAVPLEQASPALRLAASASAFSEWLATSPYAAEVTPDSVLGYLRGVPETYGVDARPKKLEWMVRQAKSIAGKQ
jgi:Mg-chelatase subunit ChlD